MTSPAVARFLPAAVRILLTDREALTHSLRTPCEHWTRARNSNFIERT
jgi:hypothetical protein